MFVSRIIDHPYYLGRYEKFKEYFKTIEHTIFSRGNLANIEDDNIVEFVEEKEFIKCFQNYKVMFYDSTEKRHIYYHPLEAIAIGMPMVFLAGGMMERLSGDVKQPAMARTYDEAKEKIQRILGNDVGFINEIKKCQAKILEKFETSYVEKMWRENFLSETAGD